MSKTPASPTVSTFADLPQLYAAYPTHETEDRQAPTSIALDAEIEHMQEGEGSAITRGDLDALYESLGITDPFAASFGDPLPLSVIEIGDEPTDDDLPDPFAAQAETGGMVATLFDLYADTRLERYASDVAWGVVNTFHFTAQKIEREEDRLADQIREMTRRMENGEVFNKELEDLQLRCQSLAEIRACFEAQRDYAAAMYRACSGRAWIPSKGSRATVGSASQIHALDFLRARAEKRRDRYDPQGPIVVVSGPDDWHDYRLIWDRLDLILKRIPHMIVVTTGQRTGTDAVAAAWAEANGRPCVGFDLLGYGRGKSKGFRRNKTIHDLTVTEAVLCQGSGIQSDLYDLFNPQEGRRVPTHVFYRDQQRALPPMQPSRRLRSARGGGRGTIGIHRAEDLWG